jgi:hypothetical protein
MFRGLLRHRLFSFVGYAIYLTCNSTTGFTLYSGVQKVRRANPPGDGARRLSSSVWPRSWSRWPVMATSSRRSGQAPSGEAVGAAPSYPRGPRRISVCSAWNKFCYFSFQQFLEIIAYFEQVSRGIKFVGAACRCFKLHLLFLD